MLGLLTFTCSVVCLLPQAYSNKLRLAALEVPGFIFLWCLGAQRKGMVINMAKAKITLTLVGRLGPCRCHHGHQVGDTFDFDTDRGKLCPMALHAGFPYIDILRYGGKPPLSRAGDIRFCCPDADVANVFRIQVE